MKYIKLFEEEEDEEDYYLYSDSGDESFECRETEIRYLLGSNLIQKDQNSDYDVYFFHDEDFDEVLKELNFIRSSTYRDAKKYNL